MGWLHLTVCIAAPLLLYGQRLPALFWGAVVVAMANFWSFGIMHSFKHDPDAAPNSWTIVNLVTAVAGLGLVVAGIVLRITY